MTLLCVTVLLVCPLIWLIVDVYKRWGRAAGLRFSIPRIFPGRRKS
jgi:hypothetical protein